MAKLSVLPEQDIISGFKGKIDFYVWRGIPVARKWPRSPGHNRSPAVQAQWVPFAEAAALWSQLPDEIREAYQEMALGSPMTARDLFTQSYISGNIEIGEEGEAILFEGARVFNDAAISIPNTVWTDLTFNSERYDTDNIHDPATNPQRLTFKTTGIYLIIANARFAINATGVRGLRIQLNGSTLIGHALDASFATYAKRVICSTIYQFNLDDFVEVEAWQSSGGALNVEVDPNCSPEFMTQRIG